MKHPTNRAERFKIKFRKENKSAISKRDRDALVRMKLEQEALEQKEILNELRREISSRSYAEKEADVEFQR